MHYLGFSPILIQDSYIPLASNSNTSLLGIKSFVKTPSGCPIHPLLSAKNKSSDCYQHNRMEIIFKWFYGKKSWSRNKLKKWFIKFRRKTGKEKTDIPNRIQLLRLPCITVFWCPEFRQMVGRHGMWHSYSGLLCCKPDQRTTKYYETYRYITCMPLKCRTLFGMHIDTSQHRHIYKYMPMVSVLGNRYQLHLTSDNKSGICAIEQQE